MLSKQDGPRAIRVLLIATFRLLPEHAVCLTLFSKVLLLSVCLHCFLQWFCCSCLTHSNKTVVKSNVSKHIAIKPYKQAMLSKRDGPGAIGVVLIATFRLLPEHLVCSILLCSTVLLLCLSYYSFSQNCYSYLLNTSQYSHCKKARLAHK